MARNEDGEYELVVGNKQLLSVVFLLIVLFGVFFSLGYFVGRNSTPEGGTSPETAAAATRGGVAQPQAAPPADPNLAPGEAKVNETEPTDPPPTETATTEPAPSPTEVKPEPPVQRAAEPAPTPRPAAPPASGGGVSEPQPGVYLQVAAVRRAEAEVVADVLRRKGFAAIVAPVVINGAVSDSLFRALVGPVNDAAERADAKSKLEAAGFKPIVRKY